MVLQVELLLISRNTVLTACEVCIFLWFILWCSY
jgi:hypothetical protein